MVTGPPSVVIVTSFDDGDVTVRDLRQVLPHPLLHLQTTMPWLSQVIWSLVG